MPTATLLHFSESEQSISQFLGPLPPARVWVPADDLPAALSILALLQSELPAHDLPCYADDAI